MGIKNMQGTSAYLQYVGPHGRKRRSNCIHNEEGVCYNHKNQTYMAKCVGRLYCSCYKDVYNNEETDEVRFRNSTKGNMQINNKKYLINKRVTLIDIQENETLEIVLVEDKNKDEFNNKISIDSPLGEAICKSSKGMKFKITQGSNVIEYILKRIR